QEKPWNRAAIGRLNPGGHFPGDFAAIVVLPGWAAEVLAQNVALLIIENRFRSFERPDRLTGVRTAHIDLKAPGVEDQEKFFTGGRFDQVRYFGDLHREILAFCLRSGARPRGSNL